MLHAGQAGFQGVIVPLGHGIEFVIVTAGATRRHSQESAAGRADHVVQFVGSLSSRQHRIWTLDLVPGPGDQETRRGVLTEDVPGQLFPDELIVRFIFIEAPDDIIAIGPGIRPRVVHLEPVGFGEPDHVQPVPGPALAVARRS